MTLDDPKKVALVTGGNRGIGYEIARQLAKMDIKVIIAARDNEKCTLARDNLRSEALDIETLVLDVTDPNSLQAAIGRIRDDFRRLDVLVNNAGILIDPQTGILELDPIFLQKTLETNAFGPLLLSQACVPIMKVNGYGRIVNMASSMGSLNEIANPDSPYGGVQAIAYRLSKTLLNGLTIMLAKELRGTNILVNSACPGWVRTEMGGPDAPLTPAQGAETPVWLATLPDDGPTGGFFREKRPIPW